MEKCRNVRIGEDVWARVKQRALDERVTVREVAERAFHQYLGVDGALGASTRSTVATRSAGTSIGGGSRMGVPGGGAAMPAAGQTTPDGQRYDYDDV